MWIRQRWIDALCGLIFTASVFVLGNLLADFFVSMGEATSRIEVVEMLAPAADPGAIERSARVRRAVPFLVLNATIAGGLALAYFAGRLEERRRRSLGFPPGLDEQRVQALSRLPRRPIAGRRTLGFSWLDRKHRFDITGSNRVPSRPPRHP